MNEERMARLAELFERALAVGAEHRPAVVEQAGDDDLRQELLALLAAHDTDSGPFDDLAGEVAAPGYGAVVSRAVGRAPPASIEELAPLLSSGYRIERELGGGAMSQVFLAEEIALGRKVVIKVLPPTLSATMSGERFRREIQLAAQLQHAHIVPLLTSGSSGQLVYYTMPFVTGESLRARLAREGRLPIRDAVKIWRDVLDALAHAHGRKVVHRDIKPGNILLGDRNALVTDFGIARAIEAASGDPEETGPGLALGTPGYMAPEQITGDRPTDGRMDLYSAALVTFEMIEGRPPFAGQSTRELLSARLANAPPVIEREDCPAQLKALVTRCLARDPAERPATAEGLLIEVEGLLRAPPAGASRPTIRLMLVAGAVVIATVLGLRALDRRGGAADLPPAATAPPSIAVLPLANLSPDPADAALADGMTEELTATLGREGNLHVIASTSVTALMHRNLEARAIAESLRVSHLLEGSLRKSGSTLRVQVRLVDARDGATRWSERYDRQVGDLFAVQDEIARVVAAELGGRLATADTAGPVRGHRPTLVAYHWYLQARNAARSRGPDNRRQSAEYFHRAIEADSSFAAPHAGLAWHYLSEAGTLLGDHRAWFDSAEQASRRAVALDATFADGHSALGWSLLSPRDWTGAEAELLRAVAIDRAAHRGYEGLARLYMLTGRPAEQLAAARRGLEIDPYSVAAIREMALAFNMNYRCGESLELLRPLKDLSPPAGVAGVIRGQCFAKMNQWPEAIAEFRWADQQPGTRAALGFLGYALARGGRPEEARGILADLLAGRRGSHGAFGIAVVYTGLRDYDRAFEWLAKSVKDWSWRDYLMDPLFDDLHRDPRFRLLWAQ